MTRLVKLVTLSLLSAPFSLVGQQATRATLSRQGFAAVPFAGCQSDGQTGPQNAPKGPSRSLPISRESALKLAYYKAASGPGVLAPRGWYCFSTYGSGGNTLFVSPQPFGPADALIPQPPVSTGPAIQLSYRFGGTSGRFSVAEVIGRVFPDFWKFATEVTRELDPPAAPLTLGPYPADALNYKNKTTVEFKTPPHTEGLGTSSWFARNDYPIDGAAILITSSDKTEMPDLVLLRIRPSREFSLTQTIIRELEREAAACCDAAGNP